MTEQQKIKCLLALKAIHDKDVFHNDIREENNDVYLIDFGMASHHYNDKESLRLFDEEKRKLTRLLDHYTLLDSV